MTFQTIKPNEAQQAALNALQQTRNEGKSKGLVIIATGVGKTILAALDTIQVNARSILFMVHRNEINYQAVEEFRKVRGDIEAVGFINGDLKEFDKPIVFATVQTLSRPDNLKQLENRQFDYFIIDEAHHTAAPSYQRVLKAVKAQFVLGLTATPERLREGHVKQYFDDNAVFELGLKDAIDKKILVPFIYYGLHDNIDYSDIKWNGRKYSEKDLNKKLLIEERDNAILKEFQYYCGNRQTIGFCVNIRHANLMATKFNKLGIKAQAITHKTDSQNRAKAIQAFKSRELQAIFTKDIFNEGVDFPNVEALLFLRPTFSPIVFFQQLGRGLRKTEGKDNVLVLDFIGNEHNASRRVEWLRKSGILISLEKGQTKPKPEYDHYTPQVWFDAQVIDIFNTQERPEKSTDALLADIRRLYQKFGKVTCEIIDQHGAFGQSSSQLYTKYYFTHLNDALVKAGIPCNRDVPDQMLLDELKRVYGICGAVTQSNIKKYGRYSTGLYYNRYGSILNAVQRAGLPVVLYKNKLTSLEELKNNYYMLKAKLGRRPVVGDFKKKGLTGISITTYKNRCGSWSNFLKQIGEL